MAEVHVGEARLARGSLLTRVRGSLPQGLELPRPTWEARHRTVLWVLALQAVAWTLFGIYQHWMPAVAIIEGGLIGALAYIASIERLSRRFRGAVASLGCVTSSAVLVQFSGGVIEAHFHFFVMVALVALYQDWVPFLLAILYVAVDHGLIGSLAPQWVYNHPDAITHPWKWAAVHAVMVLAECGALVAFWGGAEQAKARSDLVLDSAGEGIVGLGLDGTVTFVNRSAATLARKSPDALIGKSLAELLREPGGGPWAPPGHGTPAEARLQRAGAPDLPVEAIVTPTLRAGAQVGSVVTMRDVSERKAAEREIQSSLSMLSATLESTADGILVVDAGGRIVNTNQKFGEMWRMPADILASRDDQRALAFVLGQLKDPEGFLAKVESLYAQPDAESFDLLEFKDGRVFERYSKPQRIGGQSVGRVWSFRDITEQRIAEEDRLKKVEALKQVEQLTEQDRFKTQLLNMASHELNTPIGALRLQVHLLRNRLAPEADERTRHGFQVLDRNVERLSVLVRDTLDVARLQSGRLRLNPQDADMARMLTETLQSFEQLAHQKTVTLTLSVPGPLALRADVGRITQVLFNLVANALKFTPEGGRITVEAARSGPNVQVRVRDSGRGIEPAQISRLFQPFSQLDIENAPPGGTGLGLYISRGIVEQHGGRIWCESEGIGHGAVFVFEVPVAGPAAATPAQVPSAAPAAPAPPPPQTPSGAGRLAHGDATPPSQPPGAPVVRAGAATPAAAPAAAPAGRPPAPGPVSPASRPAPPGNPPA
ncbi:MAG TPA: PAS domain-containing sensor histidine kinase [Candidatus Thermoplasmatota archaeon]|nr:PAS domain-containing sensor histidine kinase [Candidatus Thermoplasmatota archaeon]